MTARMATGMVMEMVTARMSSRSISGARSSCGGAAQGLEQAHQTPGHSGEFAIAFTRSRSPT